MQKSITPSERRAGYGRRGTILVALAILVIGGCLVPLPCRVRAPALLEADQTEQVYVTVPGRLVTVREVGDTVEAGETIAVLENDELVLETETLSARVHQQTTAVRTLEARRVHDSSAAGELPGARESLETLRSQLDARQEEGRHLTLKALRRGTILPAPARISKPFSRLELVSWDGLPTDSCNEGAYLETGTLICSIGNKGKVRAVVYLNEKDVELVGQGDSVSILLEQSRQTVVEGEVHRIDALQLEDVPPRLAVLGVIPSVFEGGTAKPVETYYRAEIRLRDSDCPLVIGMRGRARIAVAPLSILQRAFRILGYTFRRAR